jgi:hypothetical protein
MDILDIIKIIAVTVRVHINSTAMNRRQDSPTSFD